MSLLNEHQKENYLREQGVDRVRMPSLDQLKARAELIANHLATQGKHVDVHTVLVALKQYTHGYLRELNRVNSVSMAEEMKKDKKDKLVDEKKKSKVIINPKLD